VILVGAGWAVASYLGVFEPDPGAPGAAPPGKVWSEEHQHWHDAPNPSAQPLGQTVPPPATNPAGTPQPEGPVPPGKVWSTEHGHWHDQPGASAADSTGADGS